MSELVASDFLINKPINIQYCGNAYPWLYPNFVCMHAKASSVPEDNYYEQELSYPLPKLDTSFQGYGQYGALHTK